MEHSIECMIQLLKLIIIYRGKNEGINLPQCMLIKVGFPNKLAKKFHRPAEDNAFLDQRIQEVYLSYESTNCTFVGTILKVTCPNVKFCQNSNPVTRGDDDFLGVKQTY